MWIVPTPFAHRHARHPAARTLTSHPNRTGQRGSAALAEKASSGVTTVAVAPFSSCRYAAPSPASGLACPSLPAPPGVAHSYASLLSAGVCSVVPAPYVAVAGARSAT